MSPAAADLKFPIVIYTDRFIEGRIKDPRFLTRTPGIDLRTSRLRGGITIDATGRKRPVLSVMPKGRIWSLESLLWKGGLIRIEVVLGPPEQMTLADAKKELIDLFKKTNWHRTSYPQWRSYEKDIEQTESFEELINAVDYFPSPSC